jgi:GTP-binding protein
MSISFKQARFVTSAFELSQLLPDRGAEVAFAGRSNAGKSSAINCLTRQKNLCKTSKTPGRTQLINFFELVVDIRRGITELDRALIDMIDHSLPLHILLTKSDKLSRSAIAKAVAAAESQLTAPDQSVSTLSVLNRQGLEQLEQKCREWLFIE